MSLVPHDKANKNIIRQCTFLCLNFCRQHHYQNLKQDIAHFMIFTEYIIYIFTQTYFLESN